MNTALNTARSASGIFVALLLASCSSPAQEAPSQTPEPPLITFQVEFDGEQCGLHGPAQVPVGYVYVRFENGGDHEFGPWADHFLDGKTYGHFLTEVHSGPHDPHPEPEWVDHAFYYKESEEVWAFNLDEPGEYGIFVGSYTPWQEYPCGGFQVVETQSE